MPFHSTVQAMYITFHALHDGEALFCLDGTLRAVLSYRSS